MKEAGLQALVSSSRENVLYTSGCEITTQRSIPLRLALTVLPLDRDPIFLLCNIEESRAKFSRIGDVRTYVEYAKSPMKLLAEVIEELGLKEGNVGIDKQHLQAVYFEELVRLLPATTFLDSSAVFLRLRMIKTDEEVRILEAAAQATEKALKAAFETAKSGDTERSIAANIQSNLVRMGAHLTFFMTFGSGINTTVPHYLFGDKTIAEGEILYCDVGGVFSGYNSDLVRMAVVGKPSEKQVKRYKNLISIHRKLIEASRPGVKPCQIYEMCRKEYRNCGYDLSMPHIGHSIGLALHEHPAFTPFDMETLKPNMVLCLEPGYHFPDEAYHIEDMFVVTNDSSRVLSSLTYRDIDEPYII